MATMSCKECVFADYKGITQTSCSLSRIEKFRKRKVGKVIEAFDNDKEFFVLENIQCNAHRTQDWLKNHQRHEVFAEMRVSVLVYVYMSKDSTYEQLVKTLKSVKAQEPYDRYKLVVRSQTTDKIQIPKYIKDNVGSNNEVVDYNVDPEQTFVQELNNSIRRHNYHYYVVVNTGYVLPKNFLHNFDHIINQEVKPVGMIKPVDDKYNLFVCNTALHKAAYDFTLEVDLIEQIQNFIPENQRSEMILEHK